METKLAEATRAATLLRAENAEIRAALERSRTALDVAAKLTFHQHHDCRVGEREDHDDQRGEGNQEVVWDQN